MTSSGVYRDYDEYIANSNRIRWPGESCPDTILAQWDQLWLGRWGASQPGLCVSIHISGTGSSSISIIGIIEIISGIIIIEIICGIIIIEIICVSSCSSYSGISSKKVALAIVVVLVIVVVELVVVVSLVAIVEKI